MYCRVFANTNGAIRTKKRAEKKDVMMVRLQNSDHFEARAWGLEKDN